MDVTPDVIAMDTSPVDPVMDTEKSFFVGDSGYFLSDDAPVYPDRFEAVPSVSVELNISLKSTP